MNYSKLIDNVSIYLLKLQDDLFNTIVNNEERIARSDYLFLETLSLELNIAVDELDRISRLLLTMNDESYDDDACQ